MTEYARYFEDENEARRLARLALQFIGSPEIKIQFIFARTLAKPPDRIYDQFKVIISDVLMEIMINAQALTLDLGIRQDFLNRVIQSDSGMHPTKKFMASILQKNLHFEKAYVRLDSSIDFGSVHTAVTLGTANRILQEILTQEQENRKLLNTVQKVETLKEIMAFVDECAKNPDHLIRSMLCADILSAAKNTLELLMESLLRSDLGPISQSKADLWKKIADQNEFPILDHNKEKITLGRIIQLVFDKLLRVSSHERYTSCVAAFLNALANKEALELCGSGALGNVLRSLESLSFGETKKEDSKFESADEGILVIRLPQLKRFFIQFIDFIHQNPNATHDGFMRAVLLENNPLNELREDPVIEAFLNHP